MFGYKPTPSPPKPQPGLIGFVKSCYNDSFKWSIIKSWSMFAFGVFMAKEVCNIDVTSPPSVS